MDYRKELKKKLIQYVVNIDTDMVNRQIKNYLSQGHGYEEIYKALVYWYEVKGNEDSISLFTRLNIGKIPLTSS